jgi:membrane protease YdiL (CAAX protease family)
MQNFSVADYRTTIVNFVLSLVIIIFIMKNKLGEYYGLTKLPKFREFLYFIPLVIIMSVNLWSGINVSNSIKEITFYILSMIGVGFLEEIIFRGFLFKMMEKDNVNRAIIVTQMIPRCVEKNKKEIIRALYMEADNLFSVYNFKVNIVLDYE